MLFLDGSRTVCRTIHVYKRASFWINFIYVRTNFAILVLHKTWTDEVIETKYIFKHYHPVFLVSQILGLVGNCFLKLLGKPQGTWTCSRDSKPLVQNQRVVDVHCSIKRKLLFQRFSHPKVFKSQFSIFLWLIMSKTAGKITIGARHCLWRWIFDIFKRIFHDKPKKRS